MRRRPLLRAVAHLRPYWLLALGALSSMGIVSAANLWSPQILRRVIDLGIMTGDQAALLTTTLLLIGVALVRGLFSFTQGYLGEKMSQGLAYDLRNLLYGKIQNLSFSYHDKAQTGQLMTRVTSDVEQVRTFMSMGLLQVINTLIMLVGTIIALVMINWQLTLFSLLTIPIMVAVIVRFMLIVRPLFGQVQNRLGALNTVLQENLVGIRVVQAFAREPYEAARYKDLNNQLLDVNIKALYGIADSFPLIFFIANIGTLIVIWFGGHQVIGGILSLGELVAFNTYLALLVVPVLTIGMILAQIARAGVSAERIFEVADAISEVRDRPGAQPLPHVTGTVAFEEVTFRYAGGERQILDKVSFIAKPGMTVAIMGQTGSGKSTIINLLPRFYDASEGRVTVDGYDIREVTLDSLRNQIGIVLQDTTLFTGSIRDNIAYGRPDASDADIEAVARAAQAHEFIASLPAGYTTEVGERGVTLSGGQRQRIAIARALLRDPRILILDDSTSSVDAETEYQLQQALNVLMQNRTSFVIAQRISTVRNADLILLLDQGRIVAQGTHEELLASSALYGEIIDSQFVGDTVADEKLEPIA